MQVTPDQRGNEADKIHVELKAQDSLPVSGSIELNNRQSFSTIGVVWRPMCNSPTQAASRAPPGLSWQYAPWRPGDANTLSLMWLAFEQV